MYIEQPYDSNSLANAVDKNLPSLINRYIVNEYSAYVSSGKLKPVDFPMNPDKYPSGKILKKVMIIGDSQDSNDIKDFDFGITDGSKNWISFDMRNYYKVNGMSGDIEHKQSHEFDYVKVRNNLTGLWVAGWEESLYNFSLPHLVFAKWISSLITKKFGLTPVDEADISTVALIYYSRLFNKPEDRQDELDLISLRFKETYFNRGMFDRVYTGCEGMETLEDFCRVIFQVTGNVRLKEFNPVVLFRLTYTSWLGVNSKQYVALALEYPPIWISMVYSSLATNAYKRTEIGDRAAMIGRRGEDVSFVKSINAFMDEKLGA